jgi:hypothetical protein
MKRVLQTFLLGPSDIARIGVIRDLGRLTRPATGERSLHSHRSIIRRLCDLARLPAGPRRKMRFGSRRLSAFPTRVAADCGRLKLRLRRELPAVRCAEAMIRAGLVAVSSGLSRGFRDRFAAGSSGGYRPANLEFALWVARGPP